MSAAATVVAASASSTNPAAGTAAAAAALTAQVSTGCLCVNPIHASGSMQKGSTNGPAAGNCRQQATQQSAKQVAAITSYAVLPATPASSNTKGPGPELLGASCVLTGTKAAVVPAGGSDSSTGRRYALGSVGSSSTAVHRQVAGAVQAVQSGVGPASVPPESATTAGVLPAASTLPAGLLLLLLPVTGYVLLGCGLGAAVG